MNKYMFVKNPTNYIKNESKASSKKTPNAHRSKTTNHKTTSDCFATPLPLIALQPLSQSVKVFAPAPKDMSGRSPPNKNIQRNSN